MTDCEAPKGGDRGRKQSSLAQKGVAALSGGIEELNILFILYFILHIVLFTISTCLILIVYLTFFKHSLLCLLERKREGKKMGAAIYKEIRAHLPPPPPHSSQHLGNCSSGTLCSGRSPTSKQEENEGSNFLSHRRRTQLFFFFSFFVAQAVPHVQLEKERKGSLSLWGTKNQQEQTLYKRSVGGFGEI